MLSDFAADFYGAQLKLVVLGFVRPEYDYDSLEELVEDIRKDIDVTKNSLERPPYAAYRDDAYLVDFESIPSVAE